eukprot:CAMPEP_0170630244 /NCGR_PEP_ID=MMETSP0224-20130122/33861_1 /TAXON_ID=285029 /ORGANISM="Togula jolla, Strain CCCM 725" /LENGTH=98 /DNA_ID=CAMNT_0010958217 /DNA_START=51 /DNA_END=347 /DNA_ORIENTATION=-
MATPIGEARLLQQSKDCIILPVRLDHPHKLHNILVALQFIAVAYHDLVGLRQDLTSEGSHFPRPGRSEEERVSFPGTLRQDLPDLGLEVKHPIRLIQN